MRGTWTTAVVFSCLLGGCASNSSSTSPASSGPKTPAVQSPRQACAALPVQTRSGRQFLRVAPEVDLYLDSAGNEVLFTDVVETLALTPEQQGEMRLVNLDFKALPRPVYREGRMLVLDRFAAPMATDENASGVLGPSWFTSRRWKMDLTAGTLAICEGPLSPLPSVAFLGVSDAGFATVDVDVGSETLRLLWDTGAHTKLTPAAKEVVGGETIQATSFLGAAAFDRWRQEHAQWRYIEGAEATTGAAMLEIPSLKLGGAELGPLWVVRRPEANFSEFMSKWTDRPVAGALGNNALRGREVRMDYPAQQVSLGARGGEGAR